MASHGTQNKTLIPSDESPAQCGPTTSPATFPMFTLFQLLTFQQFKELFCLKPCEDTFTYAQNTQWVYAFTKQLNHNLSLDTGKVAYKYVKGYKDSIFSSKCNLMERCYEKKKKKLTKTENREQFQCKFKKQLSYNF